MYADIIRKDSPIFMLDSTTPGVADRIRTNLFLNPRQTNSTGSLLNEAGNTSVVYGNVSVPGFGSSTAVNVTANSTGNSSLLTSNISVNSDTDYVSSVYIINTSSASQTFDVWARHYTSANAEIGSPTSFQTSVTLASGAATRVFVSRKTEPNVVRFRQNVRRRVGAANATWSATFSMVEPNGSTTTDYFDGTTPNTKTQTTVWTGTVNNSPSTLTSAYVEAARTINMNSSLPLGLSSMGGGTSFVADSTKFDAQRTGKPTAVKGTPNSDQSFGAGIRIAQKIPANTVIRVSAYAYSDVAVNLSGYGEGTSDTGSYIGIGTVSDRINLNLQAGVLTRVSYVVTTTQNVNGPKSGFLGSTTPVWLSEFQVTIGSAMPGDAFDGSTTDAFPYIYEWTGAPNASPSVQRIYAERSMPLIAGSYNSLIVGPRTIQNSLTYMSSGDEKGSYGIEMWFNPVSNNEIVLFDQPNVKIVWNGSIELRVQVNGQTTTLSYIPEVKQTFYLVCNYSPEGLEMFVNGIQVGYLEFESSVVTPWVTSTLLTVGSGVGAAMLDGLAVYVNTLPIEVIKTHYSIGRDISGVTGNLSSLNSVLFHFHNQDKYLIKRENWPDWTPGFGAGVNIDSLNNLYSESGGTWTTFISIENYEVISRSKISWIGTGVTVKTSINEGSTWSAAINNSFITGVSEQAPFSVMVEVAFTPGGTLSSLEVELFNSLIFYNGVDDFNDVYVSGSVAVADQAYDQIGGRHDRGMSVYGAGGFVINLSATDDFIYAIDMWVRREAAGTYLTLSTGQTITATTVVGGRAWFNGAETSYSSQPNEWVHVIFILDVPSKPTSIQVGQSISGAVGSINIYRTPVNNQESRIYRSYFGGRQLTADEANSVTIIDDAPDLYQYDWTTA